MCVTDHHDIILAVKVALNPDTANKPNFPRAKKERNKESTIISIILVLKMYLQGMYPAASHSQVGRPNHSAKKAVKAIFYTKELKSTGCLSTQKYIDADLSIFKMHLRMPDHYKSYTQRLRHDIYNKEGLG